MLSDDEYTTLKDLREKDAQGEFEDYSLEQEMKAIGFRKESPAFSQNYDIGDLL